MSPTIRLQTPDINVAKERIELGLRSGIGRAVGVMTNAAIEKAPRRTGTLKRSIQAAPVEAIGGRFLGKVVQNAKVAKYGVFVEYGTGIYGPKGEPIKPKTAPFLVWKDKNGFHRAKEVRGMMPRSFMRTAFLESLPLVEVVLNEELHKAVKG